MLYKILNNIIAVPHDHLIRSVLPTRGHDSRFIQLTATTNTYLSSFFSGGSRNFRRGFQFIKTFPLSMLSWDQKKKGLSNVEVTFVAFLSLNIGLSVLSYPLNPFTWTVTKKVSPARPLVNWMRHAHIFRGGFSWNHCNPLYPPLFFPSTCQALEYPTLIHNRLQWFRTF